MMHGDQAVILRVTPDGEELVTETRAGAPPIVLNGLHKSFGTQRVVEGVDLTVGGGQTVAVLSRSGTGKSVLLKLIVGLQKPDSGSIRIHGREIPGSDVDAMNAIRKSMGFLFQHAALYDSLTVAGNVAFPLRRHTKMARSERGDRVAQLLSSVGMENDLRKMPSNISGGMQKRVGLARALALDPGILLFDEPTAGLLLILAAGILLIGDRQYLFSSTYRLKTQFASIAGMLRISRKMRFRICRKIRP
jgi:phospholipid/cholesterol/gamma-HCH transport system ATP-binding protein